VLLGGLPGTALAAMAPCCCEIGPSVRASCPGLAGAPVAARCGECDPRVADAGHAAGASWAWRR